MKRRVKGYDEHSRRLYKDKGIAVCDEWQDFMPFYEWAMASGYDDSLSIDRIDASKGYCPENCRWATIDEQHKHLTARPSKYGRNIKKISKNSFAVRCYENGKEHVICGFKSLEEAVAYRDEWRLANGYY